MHSHEDIEGMELKILHALSWRLYPPTSLQVADQIISLMLSQDARTKIGADTLDLLQEEVAFQTENAVRDSYFATQLPSTISAAAIMNAIELVCDQDCEYLTKSLICVIGRFPFESHAILLGARNRLLHLANEEEVEENDTTVASEESWNASVDKGALNPARYHIYHNLMRESLEKTPSPPRLVTCDNAWDESSCATMH